MNFRPALEQFGRVQNCFKALSPADTPSEHDAETPRQFSLLGRFPFERQRAVKRLRAVGEIRNILALHSEPLDGGSERL